MPGMLFMRTLRSRTRTRRSSRSTPEAEKIPGVRKILHRGNLPEEYKDVNLGSARPTRFLFSEEVFEVGAPIAVVAADSEHIADEAMRADQGRVRSAAGGPGHDGGDEVRRRPSSSQSNLDGTTIAVTAPLVRGDPTRQAPRSTSTACRRKATEQHLALEMTNSLS